MQQFPLYFFDVFSQKCKHCYFWGYERSVPKALLNKQRKDIWSLGAFSDLSPQYYVVDIKGQRPKKDINVFFMSSMADCKKQRTSYYWYKYCFSRFGKSNFFWHLRRSSIFSVWFDWHNQIGLLPWFFSMSCQRAKKGSHLATVTRIVHNTVFENDQKYLIFWRQKCKLKLIRKCIVDHF